MKNFKDQNIIIQALIALFWFIASIIIAIVVLIFVACLYSGLMNVLN
jgi:hypothetical protein